MAGVPLGDADAESFLNEVEKEIVVEAESSAWHHPKPGDLVTVEVGERTEGHRQPAHTWRVGAGPGLLVGGADVDRCVRTMRRGEAASMRLKAGSAASEQMRLVSFENTEDLEKDGRLVRTTVQAGTGWQTPQAGSELRVRFSWRTVPTVAPAPSCAEGRLRAESAEHIDVFLRGSAGDLETAASLRELADLQRTLLDRFGGSIAVRYEACSSSEPALSVVRGGSVVARAGAVGPGSMSEVRAALLKEPASNASASRAPREVTMCVEAGRVTCSAEDWIPGAGGLRALGEMRAGQRCLVRVDSALAFGAKGLPELGVPSDACLEYDVELLRIMTLEDVSLDRSGSMMKKTMKEGEGYERPTEGTDATIKLEVRDDASGAVLVEEHEVTLSVCSGRFCAAIEETVASMKKAEVCEVRCTDAGVCTDAELGLKPKAGCAIVFSLELVDFAKVDLYALEEAKRVLHYVGRKEAGSKFFERGELRRALKRYQDVTRSLSYLDSWRDASAKADAISLRRTCYTNSAAVWIKMESWREVDQACSFVLKEDPGHEKALFRRARALGELNEYKEGAEDLQKLLKSNPGNQEAKKMYNKFQPHVKKAKEQQKEMFARMVQGAGKDGAKGDPQAQGGGVGPGGEQKRRREAVSSSSWSWSSASLVAIVVLGSAAGLAAWRGWWRPRSTNTAEAIRRILYGRQGA